MLIVANSLRGGVGKDGARFFSKAGFDSVVLLSRSQAQIVIYNETSVPTLPP